MLAQDTARGLPLDFILRQQAQPHTRTDRQTPQPPTRPGNTEVEITLLKTTDHAGSGHGGGRVRQVGGHWRAEHKALLCPTTPKYTDTFTLIFIHMYILILHIPQIQLHMYTHFFFCLILILTVTVHATLSSGTRVSVSPLTKKKKFIKCPNPKQKKSWFYHTELCPIQTQISPNTPQAPLLPWLTQQTGVTTLGMTQGRWQWVGGQQGPTTRGKQHLEAIPHFGNPPLTAQL